MTCETHQLELHYCKRRRLLTVRCVICGESARTAATRISTIKSDSYLPAAPVRELIPTVGGVNAFARLMQSRYGGQVESHRRTLERINNGSKRIGRHLADRLATALRIHPSELWEGEW